MAKEFFELWQETSLIKKIIAVLGIIGFIAASIVSIFNLKDMLIEKKTADKKDEGNIYYNFGNGNTQQQGGHHNQQGGQGNTQHPD